MSFDPKCFELAEHFLPDKIREQTKEELAEHIQNSIEEWLEDTMTQLKIELGE